MKDDKRNPKFLSKNDVCRPADSGEMTVQNCACKPPLPCIVILVHGVNDVGEAYENQDSGICAGLNDRLGRTDLHPHEWKTHEFMISDADGRISTKTCSVTDQTCVGEVNRSPIIPFYWGYKPVDHAAFVADQQRYREELQKNKNAADLAYDTYKENDTRIIRNHDNANIDSLRNWLDPASAKGGGTFANATTCIPDMFGPGAAGKIIAIIGKLMSRTEAFGLNKKDWSHPIYQNPHRIYQAYAARRLADLIIAIRQNESTKNDTINIVAHSQGTLITVLANMWVKAEGAAPADCTVLNHSPYSLESRILEDTQRNIHSEVASRFYRIFTKPYRHPSERYMAVTMYEGAAFYISKDYGKTWSLARYMPGGGAERYGDDKPSSEDVVSFTVVNNQGFIQTKSGDLYMSSKPFDDPRLLPGGEGIPYRETAATGIIHSGDQPSSRLLAILQPLLHTTHTAEGIVAVINSQAPNTKVEVFAHHPVRMPVAKRARLSIRGGMTLDQNPIPGDETHVAGYCSRVELSTDDPAEAKGWMPDGQLRQDVMALLHTLLGCDYDLRFWLTVPTRLLPVPRLGDAGLFNGYNVMLGLRDDNNTTMPATTRIRVGRLREVNKVLG